MSLTKTLAPPPAESLIHILERSARIAPQCIQSLRRRPSRYYSSFSIENIDLTLDDGQRVSLIFKNLGPAFMHDGARRIKSEGTLDPAREIKIYQRLLDPNQVGAPRFFASLVDLKNERYWLFLERIKGRPLWQCGRIGAWQAAAQWLARFHSRFSAHRPRGDYVTVYDCAYYHQWIDRAVRYSRAWTRLRQARLVRLASRYDQAAGKLASLPRTLIHNEFYPSNILVQRQEGQNRIRPLDWETAAVGPGLIDLACLTAGRWADAKIDAMTRAYREALDPYPAVYRDERAFDLALDFCRLHMAVQWLGWSDQWSPPREHRQDWLGEAVRLAEKLEL